MNALCVGKHELFDSRRLEDHREARKLCDVCPLIVACRANLEAVKNAPTHLGGSPEGTWAGLFLGRSQSARPGRAKCGTEAAYQSHRYYGEDRDAECTLAHRKHVRAQAKRRKELRDAS